MDNWVPYAVMTVVMVIVGVVGQLATTIGPWYRQLDKPAWQPPDWLFGPAWTLIYVCIIVSVGRAWILSEPDDRIPLMLLVGVNLVLNVLWSVLFFAMRRPPWALVEIAILWLSIVALLIFLYRIEPLAGALMIPYLAWVSFASFLNLTIVRLNPDAHLR